MSKSSLAEALQQEEAPYSNYTSPYIHRCENFMRRLGLLERLENNTYSLTFENSREFIFSVNEYQTGLSIGFTISNDSSENTYVIPLHLLRGSQSMKREAKRLKRYLIQNSN